MASKKNKTIDTRKNEVRFSTSNPKEMMGKYLAKNIMRTWKEDFVDEDNGEVVTIERKEIIASVGRLIDSDLITEIQFFLGTGDITEIEVSNQKREAFPIENKGLKPWHISAQIGTKKHRFLLYANSIAMALEIVTDYIELNFSNGFQIVQVKGFDDCTILKDSLKRLNADGTETSDLDKKFYRIDVKISRGEVEYDHTFITQTKDVDTAMIIINNWISQSFKERQKENGDDSEDIDFKTSIESAVVIPCSCTIDKDFSLAYLTD